MSLPHTVTTLTCPNGSVVHVVGTVHFSKESVQDVRNTIASTRPQVRGIDTAGERDSTSLLADLTPCSLYFCPLVTVKRLNQGHLTCD